MIQCRSLVLRICLSRSSPRTLIAESSGVSTLSDNGEFSEMKCQEWTRSMLTWTMLRLSPTNIVFALSHFICEIHKLDNTEFLPKTVYGIIIMIQFHLEKLGLNFKLLDGEQFIKL